MQTEQVDFQRSTKANLVERLLFYFSVGKKDNGRKKELESHLKH